MRFWINARDVCNPSEQRRQDVPDFGTTAPRHQSDDKSVATYPQFFACRFRTECCPCKIDEGMPDKLGVCPGVSVKRRFKGEDSSDDVRPLREFFGTSRAPRPRLRGDIIDDWHAVFPREFRQRHVKFGEINEEERVGTLLSDAPFEIHLFPQEHRQRADNVREAHGSRVAYVKCQRYACLCHQIAAHPEEGDVRTEFLEVFRDV